jgi:hypothetical protein
MHAQACMRVYARFSLPTVYVDASCLAYRFRSLFGGVVAVVEVMQLLIEEVSGVVLVFDPNSRYHSKLASVQRRGVRERARHQVYGLKQKVMRISGQLRSNYLNFEERGRLQAELIESERKMKALQKKVDRESDINFEDQVVAKALQIYCGDRGGSFSVARPPFQADSYITKHTIKGKCVIILGDESDYTVLCGGQGSYVDEFQVCYSQQSVD